MNFKKVNNITGWAVFLIAFATYFLTREARGSLWDCGEFVASADKVQLPHPPGAPLFVLIGRFFIILFGDSGNTAANAVNLMSALASAATILFLFWSVTHFARKMFVNAGEQLDANQTFTTMAAGIVGALAYTFSDSFWFSAVEGEVYALSSFFTALVFWAMLKWEHADEHAGNDPAARLRSDRWIVFLFFMMGLSIGVHLLNLLTIPAIVMIYYYRRYEASTKGAIIAFLIGCLVTGIVQVGVIQYSMKAAGQFDVFFVNSLGMPFFSGFAIYFIALAALVIWALRFNEKNISHTKLIIWFILFLALSALPFIVSLGGGGAKILKFLLVGGAGAAAGYFMKPGALRVLRLALWCYAFMLIGYFVYFTALIRSNADPSIDMNNVDNPINLVYYLSREQYGEAPLVYGPHFAAEVERETNENGYSVAVTKKGEMKYVKGPKKYIEIGREERYQFKSEDKQLFPRVWDPSNDQGHADFYSDWLNLARDEQTGKYEAPTYGDNIEWFYSYQMGLMYWRYFMWNFAGKQNDIQGLGNKRDGNWITGFSFVDDKRLGDQSYIPDSIKTNKAHNKLYMLPFILGIIGCVYQFLRNKKDWVVTFLLFFFTGIAVVLYLNQPGNQPRERDYAYVGSFFVYAIWIGLAVVAFVKMAKEKADKELFQNMLLFGGILSFIVTFMSGTPGPAGPTFVMALFAAILYAALFAGITYLVRAISSGAQNARLLNISTAVICLIAPLLMAQQEWDDHDRSGKLTAPDAAKDYLESCAPNAILFTFGDNDTYPLWYAQEVEGVRPDIRVINNSLLGIDWYINQLRRKVNQSDSVDVIWTPEQIEGNNRARVYYQEDKRVDPQRFYKLSAFIDLIGQRVENEETGRDIGPQTYPVKRLTIPVDTALVRKNGTVNPNDIVVPDINIEIGKSYLDRNELIILNIISSNAWKRPIYFTSPYSELGFSGYLRKDGLTYRLVPVKSTDMTKNWLVNTYGKDLNLDKVGDVLLNKFVFDSKPGTYFDEENRRQAIALRNTYAEAAGNLADAGKKDEALKLLQKCEAIIHENDIPYAMVSRYNSHNINGLSYLEACYKAGDMKLAEKVKAALKKDFEQQNSYYQYMRTERPELYTAFDGRDGEDARNQYFYQLLGELEKRYTQPGAVKPGTETAPQTISTGAKGNAADSPGKKDTGNRR